jgi:hypothetical protein
MPYAKIFAISLNASKTFLARHLLDDSCNGTLELMDGEQLDQIQVKFFALSLPNVHYLIIYFKHRSSSGYIDSIFE